MRGEIVHDRPQELFPSARAASWRLLFAGAASLLMLATVAASAAGEWRLSGLAAVAALAAFGATWRPEYVVAAWLGLSPWASYFLRWPEDRSLVTFDRVMLLAAIGGLVAQAWRRRGRLPAPGLFEIFWLCYAVIGVASAVLLATSKPYAARIAVDGFLMPGLLFYALRSGLDRERGARPLFWAAVLLALSLPWIGMAEFFTRVDLMPWKSGSLLRDNVVRANGPFSQDNSYAIISALLVIFLQWLPSTLGLSLDRPARLVWRLAQASATAAAVVPLFRMIMAALAVAAALPYALAGQLRTLARASVVTLLVGAACLPLLLKVSETRAFQNRISDPSSAFSRAATYYAAADIIEDHPIVGVGLASYRDFFDAKYGTAWYVDVEEVSGEGAENSPHNNVLGTWAELGVFGLFFYLAAALVLAGEAWRRRAFGALALMAVYWLPGMTLQSLIYPDITLYYFAMVALALGPRTASGRAEPSDTGS